MLRAACARLLMAPEPLEAQKEMNARDGSEDIPWRTDVMDNIVEEEILHSAYDPWMRVFGKCQPGP